VAAPVMYYLATDMLGTLPSRIKRPIKRSILPYLPKPEYYLISYPKSGRTWLRMMLGTAVLHHLRLPVDDPTDLENFARYTPDFPTIRISHDTEWQNRSCPEVKFRPRLYCDSKIIFLVRDPRDVLVSFFHHSKNRNVFGAHLPEFSTPEEMIDAESGGLRTILRFYNVWAENLPKTQGYTVCYYEELKTNPEAELARCLAFLGLADVPVESLRAAVEEGEFGRMQEAERTGKFAHHRLRAPDPSNVSSFKVRKGIVGGYTAELSPTAIRKMDDIITAELSELFSRYKYRTGEKAMGDGLEPSAPSAKRR
jgi:hypothetical protein